MMRIKDLFPDASGSGRVLVLGELLLDFVPCDSDMRLSQPGTVLKTVSGSSGIYACAAAGFGLAALSGRSAPTRSASLPCRPSPRGASGQTPSSVPIPVSWGLRFSNTSPPAGIIPITATAPSAASCAPRS